MAYPLHPPSAKNTENGPCTYLNPREVVCKQYRRTCWWEYQDSGQVPRGGVPYARCFVAPETLHTQHQVRLTQPDNLVREAHSTSACNIVGTIYAFDPIRSSWPTFKRFRFSLLARTKHVQRALQIWREKWTSRGVRLERVSEWEQGMGRNLAKTAQ